MARKVVYQIVDDLDGKQLAEGEGETVRFGLDGAEYEIDLSGTNAEKLRSLLNPYIAGGRRVSSTRRSRSSGRRERSASSSSSRDLSDVRAWALANGYKVADRGRIPQSIVAAYEQAH